MKPTLYGGQGSAQSIYVTDTTRNHIIGATGFTPDGRVFRYARYSTASAVVAGKLLSSAVLVANHEDLATATSSLVIGNIKATSITIGGTALTQDQYQGLSVVDGGGEGIFYAIEGHGAFDSAASTVEVNLRSQIAVNSDADTQVSFVKSPYADCIEANTDTDTQDIFSGITQVALPSSTAAAPAYFWCQTFGTSVAWVDDTPVEGSVLTPSIVTDGNLMNDPLISIPKIGEQMGVSGTAAEVQTVYLTLRP